MSHYWEAVTELDLFGERMQFDPDGCWSWTSTKSPRGYGSFRRRGRPNVSAHRYSYELLVGPIPDGLELDHLCRNPSCVNPAHLEPVTHQENVLRGASGPALNGAKTHCHRGHEFTPDNTYARKDRRGRHCRACARLQDGLRRANRREAA